MKILALVFAALIAVGCASQKGSPVVDAQDKPSDKLTPVASVKGYALVEPIVYKNVTVIPVVTTEKVDQDKDYASLEEAKKNNWIEIIERPGNEEVDTLKVRNLGPKPILLLAGQLLLGGKQDRIVGKDTIVPVGESIDVPVYCVEPGRWDGSSPKFEYQNQVVPKKVKDAAMYGEQQEVWDRVGEYNTKAGASSGRSTVASGLSSENIQKLVDEGIANVTPALQKIDGCVGVIYAVNGKVETLEIFGAPRLWTASMEGILRGMFASAAVDNDDKRPLDIKDAKSFLARALNSDRSLAFTNGGSAARSNRDLSLMSIEADGIRGQEKLAEAPASASTPEERTKGIIHGSYSATGDK